MASTDISTSSCHLSSAASKEAAKRSVDEAFLSKMKSLVERLRLESATLKKSLDLERSGARALKAQHEAALRQLKTESKKKEEALERQLRSQPKSEKQAETPTTGPGIKRLCSEIQSLKSANKNLQEKLKVAAETERARVAELRAQEARHGARDLALQKDTRAQVHKLLEEIKSKDRVITQLKKHSLAHTSPDDTQLHKMESEATELQKLRWDQGKERSDRDDLKTDIRHRKETFYRARGAAAAASDGDSAVSSAPTSLSPQPLADMWSCGQCRAAGERAERAAEECARLADALRDARDQLELLEFRLLELEDAAPDKGTRETLTDSDSGCVSPGSRLKDSASPELRRMDSGYKSPGASPAPPRRTLAHDALDLSCSESSDSLKSSSVKEHVEQMMMSAGSAEDRACLEQVLVLLYSLQGLGDVYQIKPKRLCDIKSLSKLDVDDSSLKSQKAIATITPYSQSQRAFTSESLESLCSEEPKKTCVLQESGIFEDIETENKTTQTESCDSLECGDLNTEIQRLNSIRQKLEKRGARRSLGKPPAEEEGLECRCVKLGERHKQYYERRLKFLEGKISIYEAAQDVKKAKLAERLQKEFHLENRIQELELQLSTLQEKYEQLEEDCCELEEIENDTRLHAQQLETDYELASAQLRDMSAQRECSRAQAERLARELRAREGTLGARAAELRARLAHLERAVPALIAWNVLRALGADVTPRGQLAITSRLGALASEPGSAVARIRREAHAERACSAPTVWAQLSLPARGTHDLDRKLATLEKEKSAIEAKAAKQKSNLESQIESLRNKLREQEAANRKQLEAVQAKIQDLEEQVKRHMDAEDAKPIDEEMAKKLHSLIRSEQELQSRVRELERRETAYLEMLTQADDMWAEMEGGYKKRITDATHKMSQLEGERDRLRGACAPLKQRARALEQSESALRVALEKAQRDRAAEAARGAALEAGARALRADLARSQQAFEQLADKYKNTIRLSEQLRQEREACAATEGAFSADLDKVKRELVGYCEHNVNFELTLQVEMESFRQMTSQLSEQLRQEREACAATEGAFSADLDKVKRELVGYCEHNVNFELTLQVEMESFRQKTSQLSEQLRQEREACAATEGALSADLDKVKRELARSCKHTMDLDVTNSELKEEVESLESQLALMQKTIAQCKRKCDDKIKTISHELSIKTEELEELRSDVMRRSLRPSLREEFGAERTEYTDEGYALPSSYEYGRMHHSLSFIASEVRCSCPSMRSRLVGSLIEDLFQRIHNAPDDDLAKLCVEIAPTPNSAADDKTKAKIANYLLVAISKELVRSIGDADAKTDTEEWQRAASAGAAAAAEGCAGAGGAGVAGGAARLASVACACAAARLCAARADLADAVRTCQEEVLEHSDVKIMGDQLANAIENIVNCPSCALGTNAIVWSTDV